MYISTLSLLCQLLHDFNAPEERFSCMFKKTGLFTCKKTELRKADRMVSLSEFSFFQAFVFADQILPGSDTFDLSVGPFSLSKVTCVLK